MQSITVSLGWQKTARHLMAIDIYKPDFVAAGKFLALLAAPFGLLALLFYGAIAYLYLSTKFSPPLHSASVLIPELNTTVKLEFYGVWDEARESGRYLTVSTQTASFRSEIDGFDWVHNPRTSIYETPEHVIAILGPTKTDYFIDPSMIELKNLSPFASSVGWHYIGAFDFGGASHTLQFIPASQQSECIPMRMSRDEYWPKMSRAEYRQEDCRPR
jgi:hypothetical protein